MPTCRHVALAGIAGRDVDDVVEEIRLAMLASEVLQRALVSFAHFIMNTQSRVGESI